MCVEASGSVSNVLFCLHGAYVNSVYGARQNALPFKVKIHSSHEVYCPGVGVAAGEDGLYSRFVSHALDYLGMSP